MSVVQEIIFMFLHQFIFEANELQKVASFREEAIHDTYMKQGHHRSHRHPQGIRIEMS